MTSSVPTGQTDADDWFDLEKYRQAAGVAYEFAKKKIEDQAAQERLNIAARAGEERTLVSLAAAAQGAQQRQGMLTAGEQERLNIAARGGEERLGISAAGEEERKTTLTRGEQERLGLLTRGEQERLGISTAGEQERKSTVTRGEQERETIGKTAAEQRAAAKLQQFFREQDELRDYGQAQRAYRY